MRGFFQGVAWIDRPHPNPLPEAGEGAEAAPREFGLGTAISADSEPIFPGIPGSVTMLGG